VAIELAEKLEFLQKPARYKIIKGGRGSGKSWGVARALLLLAVQKPVRILCTREVQKSIQQSVHQLLKDQIEAIGVQDFFEVLQTTIRGKNGSEFFFAGLSDLTVDSIKSFEGVDIVWCEEAQTICDRSWSVLIPTIRKQGSEIWVTYNPELETDATNDRFVTNTPPDCVVVEMNWQDNPWFPETLELERQHAEKTLKPEVYNWIWEGKCKPAVEGAIYFDEIANAEKHNRIRDVPADVMLKTHAVWDLGWNDSMSIILVQRSASELRIVDYIEDSHRTLADYAMQLKAMPLNWGVHYLPHDGFSKDFKTGKSAQEILEALGCTVEATPNMAIEDGIRAARMTFERIYFDKTKAKRLIECLKRYRRNISKTTGEAGSPLHDEYSHGCLIAGSMVDTVNGKVAIENVRVGDYVRTPSGYALVTNSGMTKVSTVLIAVETTDGRILTMTPEHKVFTTKGVVEADTLGYNDALFTNERTPCLSYQKTVLMGYRDAFTESFKDQSIGFGKLAAFMDRKLEAFKDFCTLRFTELSMVSLKSKQRFSLSMATCATQTQTTGCYSGLNAQESTRFKSSMGSGSISSQRATTKPTTTDMVASQCTDMCGQSISETYRKECTFTTKMATNPTTPLEILNFFPRLTTPHITAQQTNGSEVKPIKSRLLGLESLLKHGIQALMVSRGIARMVSRLGKIVLGIQQRVSNAVASTQHLTQQDQSIAVGIAKLRRYESAVPVYDLTVAHHHCYFANGILVSNSDAFRYACIVADALSNSNGSVKPIAYGRSRYIA
jgi:phage terminase large subunit